MIEVTIDGVDYRIKPYSHGWQYWEHFGVSDEGSDQKGQYKYYANLEQLLKGLVEDGLRRGDYESFSGIADKLKSIKADIEDVLGELKEVEK